MQSVTLRTAPFFCFGVLLCTDAAHLLLLIVHDDTDVSAEHFVYLFVAGVHQQSAAPQVEELLLRGKYVEMLLPDAAEDLRAELLVAAPEQVPLPARRRDDQSVSGRPSSSISVRVVEPGPTR